MSFLHLVSLFKHCHLWQAENVAFSVLEISYVCKPKLPAVKFFLVRLDSSKLIAGLPHDQKSWSRRGSWIDDLKSLKRNLFLSDVWKTDNLCLSAGAPIRKRNIHTKIYQCSVNRFRSCKPSSAWTIRSAIFNSTQFRSDQDQDLSVCHFERLVRIFSEDSNQLWAVRSREDTQERVNYKVDHQSKTSAHLFQATYLCRRIIGQRNQNHCLPKVAFSFSVGEKSRCFRVRLSVSVSSFDHMVIT